jgi:starch-binding outer membrane protein, SusD/RagB family
MKTLNIYILAMSLLTLGSCKKDFLNTEDVTNATEQNFYKTPEDGFKALVGCYDGLQQVYDNGIAFPLASEVMSDNVFGGTGNSDGLGYRMMDEFDKAVSPADIDMFSGNWAAYYRGIYRCNMLISKLDQINWGTNTALRNTYEAEARFLRAYMYFDMVRLWGNVPLLTAPSSENIPQSPADEVYKVIAEDLEFAITNLAATAYTAQAPATYGRVTKWAAEALTGRVYLYYTGYYAKPDLVGVVTKAEALGYLENVINSGGFGLVSNFANLWPVSGANYAGEDNKETVFAIKYTFTSDFNGNTDGNHWLVMNGIRGQTFPPYGNGWGASTVNPKLWNAYSSTDTRKTASIISIAGEGINFTNQKDQREYTGYYTKKYTPLSDATGTSVTVGKGAGSFQISQFQDYVSIRYADVLLMAAELGSLNAQSYFDQVRQRAHGGNFISTPATQANILAERRLELAFEGIRYWDLLRQGLSAAAAAIGESTTVQNGGVNTVKTISGAKVTETKGLVQVPYGQINLSNGVLKQNQGW